MINELCGLTKLNSKLYLLHISVGSFFGSTLKSKKKRIVSVFFNNILKLKSRADQSFRKCCWQHCHFNLYLHRLLDTDSAKWQNYVAQLCAKNTVLYHGIREKSRISTVYFRLFMFSRVMYTELCTLLYLWKYFQNTSAVSFVLITPNENPLILNSVHNHTFLKTLAKI